LRFNFGFGPGFLLLPMFQILFADFYGTAPNKFLVARAPWHQVKLGISVVITYNNIDLELAGDFDFVFHFSTMAYSPRVWYSLARRLSSKVSTPKLLATV
jgi:hypothetical protein